MTSLNPVLTIGTQLIETLQEHLELDLAAAKKAQRRMLAAVGIPAPDQRADAISASALPAACASAWRSRLRSPCEQRKLL